MSSIADIIIADLRRIQAQRELAEKMGTLEPVKRLQEWQCARLLVTHDTLAKESRYQAAMQFFVDELYGPKDFSQRDADLARVVPKLAAVLPEKAMLALKDAVAVNTLSFDLDLDLINHLDGPLNAFNYATAYRKSNRLDDRKRQIDIIYHLGEQLADVVHIRGVSMIIKLARKPAQLAGLLSLHEFLEQGFQSFKKIGDVHDFINPVLSKEREIMHALLDESVCLATNNPIPEV
ncbi:FFLEELY motif protein [Alteromonas sediminis]|uniref:FFLEELY motif protein n=1 Tax=Alteromonas sediminis TaxID=2259342 RepID=UPI0030B7FB26